MEEIVRRKVCDAIVDEELKKHEDMRMFVCGSDRYRGYVKTTLSRVNCDKSEIGIPCVGVTDAFGTVLRAVQSESTGIGFIGVELCRDGNVIRKELRLIEIQVLKALAIAQISYCEEYMQVLSYIFGCMFMGAVGGRDYMDWKANPDFTEVQEYIFRKMTSFINEILKED